PARRADARARAEARHRRLRPDRAAARRGGHLDPPGRAERAPGARRVRPRLRAAYRRAPGRGDAAGAARLDPDRAGLPRRCDLAVNQVLPQAVNALALGSRYALLALGLAT